MSILRFLLGVISGVVLALSGATSLAGEVVSIDHLMIKVRERGLAGLPKHSCSPDCSAKISLQTLLDDAAHGPKSADMDDAEIYIVDGELGGVSQVVLRADGRSYDTLRRFILKAIGSPSVSGEREVLSRHVRRMDEWLVRGGSALLYAPVSRNEVILHLGRL